MSDQEPTSRSGRRYKLEARILLALLGAMLLLMSIGWFMFGRPRMTDASGTAVDPATTMTQRSGR